MKSRYLALFALVLVQLFYGVTFTFANDVIDGGHIMPFGFIVLRVTLAGALFWIVSLFGSSKKIEFKDFSKLIKAAFILGFKYSGLEAICSFISIAVWFLEFLKISLCPLYHSLN